jgi:hypothetical protein
VAVLSRSERTSASGRRSARVPSAAEAGLLAEAALVIVAVRLAQLLLPTAGVQALVRRLGRPRRPGAGAPRAAWAVDVAGRLLPAGACLSRALATQALLERRGRPARLAIGFRREPDGRLAGHAWIEAVGAALAGEDAGRGPTLAGLRRARLSGGGR